MSRSRIGSVMLMVVGLLALSAAPVASGGLRDLLPDLRMRKLTSFHYDTEGSQRLLRFDTVIINVGEGPLIVRGKRDCSSQACPRMRARQRVQRTDGTTYALPQAGWMKYSGDGHDHWHVQRMETYELIPLGDLAGEVPRRGAKVGYCFFDNVRHDTSRPGAPGWPQYGESGCGRSSSTAARMGLSVGWGDIYPWNFAYQWIDITDLPEGTYRVCVTANPEGRFVEEDLANNTAWQDVTIDGSAEPTLGASGRSPCTPTDVPGQPVQDYPDAYAIFGDRRSAVACRIEPAATS